MFGLSKSRLLLLLLGLVIAGIVVSYALGPNSTLVVGGTFHLGQLLGALGVGLGAVVGLFVLYKLVRSI